MDNAKALERMKYNLGIGIDVYTQLCGNNLPPPLSETLEAEKLAIAALEKQVAKPVKYLDRRGDGDPWWNMSKVYLNCPAYGRRLRYRKNGKQDPYCPKCGQALRWEVKV